MISAFHDFIEGLEGLENVNTVSMDDLTILARPHGKITKDGSLAFYSNVRSRSAGQSVVIGSAEVQERNLNAGQLGILDNLSSTLDKLKKYLNNAPLVCVKRTIGSNSTFNPKCTLYLSVQRMDNIRQAYLWANTLRDYDSDAQGPDLDLICIPEWPEHERQVLVFPEHSLTLVLGMDYVGEVKMGFLRMAMWLAKKQGMLSLHAGSKKIKAQQRNGKVAEFGTLLFGLSGTGKTTHSCHEHGLNLEGEGIEILQDDIVFLQKDGATLGVEQGFYIKTEGITASNQSIIYNGLSSQETLLENVMVDYEGEVKFSDMTLGSNGRAVMPRSAMDPHIAQGIDLSPVSEMSGLLIFFVTRNMTVLPIVSKLNAEQAAASFMLGESIETSAGDPRKAGESVRVVGTNPFLIGDENYEGNWFYEFLKTHGTNVQCYLLNTGGVGEIMERDSKGHPIIKQKVLRVEIPEMAFIIRGIARGSVKWEDDPYFDTLRPSWIEGVDINKFALDRFYSSDQIRKYVDDLKESRKEWLSKFPKLRTEIVQALR